MQELARFSETGVHDQHRMPTKRESRPRSSGVGCVMRSLPPRLSRRRPRVRVPSTPPTSFIASSSTLQVSARTSGAVAGGRKFDPDSPPEFLEKMRVDRRSNRSQPRNDARSPRLAWHRTWHPANVGGQYARRSRECFAGIVGGHAADGCLRSKHKADVGSSLHRSSALDR